MFWRIDVLILPRVGGDFGWGSDSAAYKYIDGLNGDSQLLYAGDFTAGWPDLLLTRPTRWPARIV